jgi:hypothetical protein
VDSVVTQPKKDRASAALEAQQRMGAGGGFYFRNLGRYKPKRVEVGDRCFYVEDNHIQGFAESTDIHDNLDMRCETKGTLYASGWYVFIDACTWKWIAPLPYSPFQGWRYVLLSDDDMQITSDWLTPRLVRERA